MYRNIRIPIETILKNLLFQKQKSMIFSELFYPFALTAEVVIMVIVYGNQVDKVSSFVQVMFKNSDRVLTYIA